ncbi:MAG TPA: hypothetical protein VGY54_03795 [Polyangiaceae bacterium]|jgi:hypothetical protein|nr:hypothetical protein [Polyangiaceae bacterium]
MPKTSFRALFTRPSLPRPAALERIARRHVGPAFLFVAAVALAGVLSAEVAIAQSLPSPSDIAHARELFNQGLHQRDDGDVKGALEKFKAAYSLAQTPLTALELGRTYMQVGQLVEARETFLSIARIPVRPEETARSRAARNQSAPLADELRMRIANLTIRVTGVPASSVAVSVDGAAVPTEALAVPRPLNPGAHEVIAKAAEGAATEARVDLKEGEAREVQLKIVVTPTPPPSPGAETASHATTAVNDSGEASGPNGPKHVSPLVYVGFAVAGAGVAAGTVTGLLAMSKASSVNDTCNAALTCPHSVHDDLSTGRTLGDVAAISFAVAGAGAIAGVVGLFLPGHKEDAAPRAASVTPWIAPGIAGLRGTF